MNGWRVRRLQQDRLWRISNQHVVFSFELPYFWSTELNDAGFNDARQKHSERHRCMVYVIDWRGLFVDDEPRCAAG